MSTEAELVRGIDPAVVLTEPMRVRELAHWFRVEAHLMRRMLNVIDGAKKIGGMWRVPAVAMPPLYLLARGLIKPAEFPASGTNWHKPEKKTGALQSWV